MSGSKISNYQSIIPQVPPAIHSSAGATSIISTSSLLDEAAVRLLADFFLLLAEWNRKQKKRDLSAALPDTTIHDGAEKAHTMVATDGVFELENRSSHLPLDARPSNAVNGQPGTAH